MAASENKVGQQLRLAASTKGVTLFRNNSGATVAKDGRMIFYGLGNEPGTRDKRWASSDFIGYSKVTITPEMVGQTIAVFTAIETKSEGFKGPKGAREQAQANFLDMVNSAGGYASFYSGVEDLPWNT